MSKPHIYTSFQAFSEHLLLHVPVHITESALPLPLHLPPDDLGLGGQGSLFFCLQQILDTSQILPTDVDFTLKLQEQTNPPTERLRRAVQGHLSSYIWQMSAHDAIYNNEGLVPASLDMSEIIKTLCFSETGYQSLINDLRRRWYRLI